MKEVPVALSRIEKKKQYTKLLMKQELIVNEKYHTEFHTFFR